MSTKSLDEIAVKIQKLMAHATSAEKIGNQAEAAAFAAKAQELLLTHKLSMSDVEFARDREEQEIGSSVASGRNTGMPRRKSRIQWQERLAVNVAHHFGCKILVWTGSNNITFVGHDRDRNLAVYVFVRLVTEGIKIRRSDYGKARRAGEYTKNFINSWNSAYVDVISRRLREMQQSLEKGASKNALVRVQNDLEVVNDWMRDNMNVGTASALHRRHGYNASGAAAGSAAGRSANLRANGVGSGRASSGRLSR